MTNKIMELAYRYAAACERRALVGRVSARFDLAAEVQAHIDYTRAVIAERDALKAELGELPEVQAEIMSENKRLRKAAQMALEAMETHGDAYLYHLTEWNAAEEALRGVLGHV